MLNVSRYKLFCGFVSGTLSCLLKSSLHLKSYYFSLMPLIPLIPLMFYRLGCLGVCWVTLMETILYNALWDILQLCTQVM